MNGVYASVGPWWLGLWWWSCRTCQQSGHRIGTERRVLRHLRRHAHPEAAERRFLARRVQ